MSEKPSRRKPSARSPSGLRSCRARSRTSTSKSTRRCALPSETDLPNVKRGEIWEIDFEPQTHKHEPGKRNRPALLLQTNLLNDAGHNTTIVIPGTTDIYRDPHG